MTLTADAPQSVSADRPALVDADHYIAAVRQRYEARGEIAPIWYLILAGGKAENSSIFDGEARNRAKSDIGESPFHPQAKVTWDKVDWDDQRLLTRQELYQPLQQRLAIFTWRNPDLVTRLQSEVSTTYLQRIAEDRSFTESLFYQLMQHGHLSIRQIETLQQHWQREDTKPAAVEAPSGRVHVTGVVKSVREEFGQYGAVTKMLVQDDTSYTTWGNVPKSLTAQPGDRVEFTATIKPAADVGHSYFSRPTKASIVQSASI